jgi:hypothetical protein
MTEIPPVSSSMPSSQSQPQNLQALAAAAFLLAELAQSAPIAGKMPRAA